MRSKVNTKLTTPTSKDSLNTLLHMAAMALLAYSKKPNLAKAVLPRPTGPLSLQIPSSCIRVANKCVSEELGWTEQVPQCTSQAKK